MCPGKLFWERANDPGVGVDGQKALGLVEKNRFLERKKNMTKVL